MVYFYLLEILVGALEAFATLLISLVLFRIPFRHNFIALMGMSFGISGIFLLYYNIFNGPFLIGELLGIIITCAFIFLIYHMKIWQAILVSLVGYICGPMLLFNILYGVLKAIHILNADVLLSNSEEGITQLLTIQFLYALIGIQVALLFYRYQIGFLLTKNNNDKNKEYPNYLKLIFLLFLTIFVCLLISHVIVYDSSYYDYKKGIFAGIVVFLNIFFVYLINKDMLINEYEEIKKKIKL